MVPDVVKVKVCSLQSLVPTKPLSEIKQANAHDPYTASGLNLQYPNLTLTQYLLRLEKRMKGDMLFNDATVAFEST